MEVVNEGITGRIRWGRGGEIRLEKGIQEKTAGIEVHSRDGMKT